VLLPTEQSFAASRRLGAGRAIGYGRKGRKTFSGETRIDALIDQEEVEKMGVS